MADRVTEESQSIRAALEQAVEEVEAGEAAEAASAEEPGGTPAPKSQPGETEAPGASEPPDTSKPPAEAKGKEKAGKDAKAAAEPDASKAPDATKAPDKDAKPEAPAHWSAADKATFAKLDPAGQKFLLDRSKSMEADYTKKTQAVAALKAEYEPIDQAFQPHLEGMKKAGFTPRTLIQSWMNVEQRLMKGEGVDVLSNVAVAYKIPPVELATRLLKAANVADPDKVVGDILANLKGGGAAATAALPPEVRAELDRINARLSADDKLKEQTESAARKAEEDRIEVEIETFKNAADQSGQLLHPYFADLEQDMSFLAQIAKAKGQPATLEELYTQAMWANSEVRAKVLEQQNAASAAEAARAKQAEKDKAAEEARSKSRSARKAGSSVTGGPSGAGQAATQQAPKRSLRETIAAAAEEAEASASA